MDCKNCTKFYVEKEKYGNKNGEWFGCGNGRSNWARKADKFDTLHLASCRNFDQIKEDEE